MPDPEETTAPKDAPPAGPCEWAADLLDRLKASGTGEGKLKVVRDAMAARWEKTLDLPADHPDRHLTAMEGAAALAKALGAGHPTVAKARAFAETGVYAPPKAAPLHAADLIPAPPRGKAPAPAAAPAEPAEVPAPAPKPKKGRGRKEPAAPGVVDPVPEIETVGPKPVADAPAE